MVTAEQMQALREAIDALPDGPWEVWTSCSFRRISRARGSDGDVLRGTVQSSDGHPDLSMTAEQLQALCDLRNTVATIVRVK